MGIVGPVAGFQFLGEQAQGIAECDDLANGPELGPWEVRGRLFRLTPVWMHLQAVCRKLEFQWWVSRSQQCMAHDSALLAISKVTRQAHLCPHHGIPNIGHPFAHGLFIWLVQMRSEPLLSRTMACITTHAVRQLEISPTTSWLDYVE